MRLYKALFLLLLMTIACSPGKEKTTHREQLLGRLNGFVADGKIAYGHQDDIVYGHSWKVEDWQNDSLERSDVKDVAGSYPMLLGFDLGGVELGDSCNLDGVPFGLIRKASLKHIERGGIVTYSWHPRNIVTGSDSWDVATPGIVAAALEGGQKHDEFKLWLQRAADFIESLGGDVPVIFRPWHENLGNWFWWGKDHCTPEEYKALYRLTRDYFAGRGLTNILWCYSPNGNAGADGFMSRYPGDDYVDILGIDTYEGLYGGITLEQGAEFYKAEVKQNLTYLQNLAKEHGKLMCFSETGLEGLADGSWWMNVLNPSIQDFPIAYVLTWRNANDKPGHFYAPWKGFEHADDFKAFCEQENIELLY